MPKTFRFRLTVLLLFYFFIWFWIHITFSFVDFCNSYNAWNYLPCFTKTASNCFWVFLLWSVQILLGSWIDVKINAYDVLTQLSNWSSVNVISLFLAINYLRSIVIGLLEDCFLTVEGVVNLLECLSPICKIGVVSLLAMIGVFSLLDCNSRVIGVNGHSVVDVAVLSELES